MNELLLSLVVYFDSKCERAAVRVSDVQRVNVDVGRSINVITHYEKINGECVRFYGDENLFVIKKVKK